MANPRVQQIVDALAEALRDITKANGYHTDLGLAVGTEPEQAQVPTQPRCLVRWTTKARQEGESRTGPRVAVNGVIEFEVPAGYSNAMALVTAAEEDIERRIAEYIQMPDALPVAYDEAVLLDRPEGMPLVAGVVGWHTAYRRPGAA